MKNGIALILVVAFFIGCSDDPNDSAAETDVTDAAGNDSYSADAPVLDTGGDVVDHFAFDFTVVALPDTQMYARYWPEIYLAQTQWIVDNASEERIIFVTHLGDVVDIYNDSEQWAVAREAMAILEEADMPYGVAMGNHDAGGTNLPWSPEGCAVPHEASCIASQYLDNFGPQRFADDDWYGGASPSGLSNYQVIEAGGFTLVFLHLVVDPWPAEIVWAQGIVDAHPGALVQVSVHRYLYDYRATEEMPSPWPLLAAGRFDEFNMTYISALFFQDGLAGDDLFEAFVWPNGNIYAVQCGHVDAEYFQQSTNVAGSPVNEILVDFQTFSPEGGTGWLRLLRYDIEGGQILVQTYSPWLDRYRVNGEGCRESIEGLDWFFEYFRDYVAMLADPDEVEAQIDYWKDTEEGFEEFCSLLYDDGERDSDFVINVDFDAFSNASQPD